MFRKMLATAEQTQDCKTSIKTGSEIVRIKKEKESLKNRKTRQVA